MKLFIIKKSIIIILLIILLISCSIFIFLILFQSKMAYKDRDYWEKTGNIVWEVNTDEKLIALTFDDGPSPTFTTQILDLLASYNAKATFFIMGKQAEKYPEIILREVQEGHELGNHTYDHSEVNKISEEELKKDLHHAHRVIYDIAGVNMKLYRPTSGYYDETIVRAAKTLDYIVIIWTWNHDSRDWTQLNGTTIAHSLIKTIKPGSIILFHDLGGNRNNTIKALQIILPVLKEKGFKFVTVSTLLEHSKDIQNVNSQ